MNKLSLPNLPSTSAPAGTYERILNAKLNELFGLLRTAINTLIRDWANGNIQTVTGNVTLDASQRTAYVTTTAKTVTLPAASSVDLGSEFTVILGTDGYVDIAKNAADSWVHTTESILRLTVKGSSISLKPVTSTKWGIV